MLFTLAHEIGHLIAHSEESEFAVIDEEIDWQTTNARERYANAFASALLLPPSGVGTALQTFRKMYDVKSDAVGDLEILFLARIYGVSFQVAAQRCEVLDLLPRGSAFSLHEKLTKEHGSPEKRADEVGLPPRPKLEFPAAPEMLVREAVKSIREGRVSLGRAASTLGMSLSALVEANASSDVQ
jgi:Zn-dependent peptidase ImmA (M78 family)